MNNDKILYGTIESIDTTCDKEGIIRGADGNLYTFQHEGNTSISLYLMQDKLVDKIVIEKGMEVQFRVSNKSGKPFAVDIRVYNDLGIIESSSKSLYNSKSNRRLLFISSVLALAFISYLILEINAKTSAYLLVITLFINNLLIPIFNSQFKKKHYIIKLIMDVLTPFAAVLIAVTQTETLHGASGVIIIIIFSVLLILKAIKELSKNYVYLHY